MHRFPLKNDSLAFILAYWFDFLVYAKVSCFRHQTLLNFPESSNLLLRKTLKKEKGSFPDALKVERTGGEYGL
jgi:hypothetical protein